MLKMEIRMNDEKIKAENRYNLEKVYAIINQAFNQMGYFKKKSGENTLVYYDNGEKRDYACFGKLVIALKKQEWFMNNVAVWKLYENVDESNPLNISEEDLLKHYLEKKERGKFGTKEKQYE